MKTNMMHLAAVALLLVGTTSGTAHARYLCDEPPTGRDARACEAAKQGPAELRRFIQRMQGVEHLLFDDYVNEATVLAWDAKEARKREIQQAAGGMTASAAPASQR